jgi:peptidoglycan hydrolase-like protein with peptidoglycan-binding domain
MKLNQIAVAVAAAVLSTSAFAGGGEHAKQQPRAESGNGAMMQSQSGPQQAQGGHQQAQAQSPELVKQAQQALNEKGLNPGPVDGQWGPQTQQAVKAYQQQNQIQATGQLDRETLASLGIGQSASAGGSSREPGSSAGSSSGRANGASASGSSGSSAPASSTAQPQKDPAGASNGGGFPSSQKD